MLPKHPIFAALVAASVCSATFTPRADAQAAPAAPAPPAAAPGTQNRLIGEVDAAFEAKDYGLAVTKIKELLVALGPRKEADKAALEILYYNIGYANLLGEKWPDAETAFRDCLKRYPNGEYASRCNLGIGRSCVQQETPEKKQQAIEALKAAATDPKLRSEAGLLLGQTYTDLSKHDEALKVFSSLMGSDVRTPSQTTAAVEVVGLLADSSKDLGDLIAYLDRLAGQAGIRDALAWYVNQLVSRADDLVAQENYDEALAIYRAVPQRNQILEVQGLALEAMRKDERQLQATVAAEKDKPINQRSKASELLKSLSPAIVVSEAAQKAIEEKKDLDAAMLVRRGRCLFYLNRNEEALVCFRALQTKYAATAEAEHGAYAEIVILNKLGNKPELKDSKDKDKLTADIKAKCDRFMVKYPQSTNLEHVATLSGEVLVQSGDWKEVQSFYRNLENKFKESENLERYVFFQGVAFFMEGNFKESTPIFTRFLKDFPNSEMNETGLYYMAMSSFLSNDYDGTLAACREYLKKYPTGKYSGDIHYRLAFIDFNDKKVDQDEKIIRDLTAFLKENPKDLANGSILCLMADTYKRKKVKTKDKALADAEIKANEDAALKCYQQAVLTDSPDDIMQYALDSATAILQRRKEWGAVAAMHADFMKRMPDSQLALLSAAKVAAMSAREGKNQEAAEMLGKAMAARIHMPEAEMVEYLIDELVKTLVPRKKPKDIDIDAIDKQLVDVLNKVIGNRQNATTAARIYYARARLAQMLKNNKRSNTYLKGIATGNAKNPAALSPTLLAVCGDILIQENDLEGAEGMFRRLRDRYSDSNFSDAGPVGLGYIALARKQPEEALKIFDEALDSNKGMSRFKEATLGRLQALVALNEFEAAKKLALEIVGDKMFRGEPSGKAYLMLADSYRKQAAKTGGEEATELLKQAHAIYQRMFITQMSQPEICGEAHMRAYEIAKSLGETDEAKKTLEALATNPKLANTKWAKDAQALLNKQ